MKGIFEGDLERGMLEASQNSGLINDIPTVKVLMERLISEFEKSKNSIKL
jgi:NAD(P)H-dependent flavin oxidoreductase YrpB (nitropropane dioxygenase family)